MLLYPLFKALRSKSGSCALAYHPTTRKNRARGGDPGTCGSEVRFALLL